MTSPIDTLPGSQIDEYYVEALLGAGGMARVYRALDTKLRRYIALKVIAPDLRTDRNFTARFEREAQAIARLEHPNIVRIYRFGQRDGLYYMAMQFIEGVDIGWLLHEYRATGNLMAPGDIVRVAEDIGSALDYAHSKDVIHRDVKPGNIMINGAGHAILTDFGLANSANVQDPDFLGSPYYIAPEQAIEGGQVVPQSDFYSLGVTLFEMLTGQVPFTGGNATAVARRHVMEQPPLPSSIEPSIPAAVEDVLMRLLEKDPAKRFQTGADLAGALASAVTDWQSSTGYGPMVTRIPMLTKVQDHIISHPLPDPGLSPALTQRNEPPGLAPFMVPGDQTPKDRHAAVVDRDFDALQPVPVPVSPPIPRRDAPPVPAAPARVGPDYSEAYVPRNRYAPGSRTGVDWRLPWALLAGALLLAVIACMGLFIFGAGRFAAGPAHPTSTPIPLPTTAPQATNLPANTAPPGATFIPAESSVRKTQTAEVEQQQPLLPTPTALQLQPDSNSPGQNPYPPTGGAIPPQQGSGGQLPPGDRNAIPPNSRRLGEFAVEGFCNSRGYGVQVVNNQTDWACTDNSTGNILFLLQPTDLDAICRQWYGNPGAFAIRDQHKDVAAYNWSCYAWTAG